MPTLDDLPTLITNVNPSGADLIPVYDMDSPSSSKVEKLPLSGILGLQAADVSTGGNNSVIDTRLFVATGTPVFLPAASGNIRQVNVLNPNAGLTCVVTRSGTDNIVSMLTQTASTVSLAAGHAAILLSDGTRWYHISNDT